MNAWERFFLLFALFLAGASGGWTAKHGLWPEGVVGLVGASLMLRIYWWARKERERGEVDPEIVEHLRQAERERKKVAGGNGRPAGLKVLK